MSQVGIVSRLSTHGGVTFTVNTAVTDVALILTGSPDLSVNGTIMNLQQGDNCTIEGFSLQLPYQFGQGKFDVNVDGDPAFFQLGWRDNAGNNGSVNEVGDTGLINIPDPNYWYETETFLPQPATVADKWHLEIIGLGGWVSQIYAPAVLDQEELHAAIHLRIRHTLPLIA